MNRWPRRLAWLALGLAFCVVVFGAFVRLSDAGLSCPDWPTCYGQATWPDQPHEVAGADAAFPDRPFEAHKAWREQVHRMLAGGLGVLVLALALIASWQWRPGRAMVMVAALAAALGVGAYMAGLAYVSWLAGGLALFLPLVAAARLPCGQPWRVAVALLALIIFQALLGMWTVTLLLKPLVVLAHLLGGMLTLALLAWLALRLTPVAAPDDRHRPLRQWVVVGLVLLGIQIALGGWTSTNYAALACGAGHVAFPHCLGSWWPKMDFAQGFVLWRGIGVDYEGGVLDLPARTAIQMVHRIGALVVFGWLLALAVRTARRGFPGHAVLLAALLLSQIGLGIANVRMALPLPVAVGHNAVAALLLLALLALLARTRPFQAATLRAP